MTHWYMQRQSSPQIIFFFKIASFTIVEMVHWSFWIVNEMVGFYCRYYHL